MTCDEKTKYLKVALGLCGISVNDATSELIWRTVKGLNKKGGDFSLRDSAKIQAIVESKAENEKKAIENKSQEKSKSAVADIQNFGRIDRKVNSSKVVSRPPVNSKKYKSHTDFVSRPFVNKYGKRCFYERVNGIYRLIVGVNEVILKNSQIIRLSVLSEKYGVDSVKFYRLMDIISDNFRSYRDASGKIIKIKDNECRRNI